MMAKNADPVTPSIHETAFSCPHCNALATQYWRGVRLEGVQKDAKPKRYHNSPEVKKKVLGEISDPDNRIRWSNWLDRVATGLPVISHENEAPYTYTLSNVDVSVCYNCNRIALWVGDQMVWPHTIGAPSPNPDLPEDIEADFREAREIFRASPRGAAALLRLCIQKLCQHLGEPGQNINNDIASLVKKGLDHRVQKSLDVVRVIGNNAVHPGEIDLRDDLSTAENLFALVNLIAEIMISQPKAIDAIYNSLPTKNLDAIRQRDSSKT